VRSKPNSDKALRQIPHSTIISEKDRSREIEELIEGIATVAEQSFRPDRRFVSASFHASDDGRRMLNYAQWTSQADYEAFMQEMSAMPPQPSAKPFGALVPSRSMAMLTPSTTSWRERDERTSFPRFNRNAFSYERCQVRF
jgi:hypothetical protein